MGSITRNGRIRLDRVEIGGKKHRDHVEFELEIEGRKIRIIGNSEDARKLGVAHFEKKCDHCGSTGQKPNASFCRHCGKELIDSVDEDKGCTVTINT